MLRKFKITIDGKTYLVEMEEIGGAPAAQPAPAAPATPAATPTPATPAAPAPAAPVAPTGEGEVVTAPMPGTVTKILVKDGDTVTENQPATISSALFKEEGWHGSAHSRNHHDHIRSNRHDADRRAPDVSGNQKRI